LVFGLLGDAARRQAGCIFLRPPIFATFAISSYYYNNLRETLRLLCETANEKLHRVPQRKALRYTELIIKYPKQ
jgi:hypothetical protein